jgi:hypothetical protein
MMVCRQPKQDIQLVSRARTMVSAVMSGMGTTSGQRVERSTSVRQYVYPADFGMGPMRSMWTCRKRAASSVKSRNGVTAWRETLECWQDWQARAQVRQSFYMPGHTKRCVISFAGALVPGCDRSRMDWNSWSHRRVATCGQDLLADMLQ